MFLWVKFKVKADLKWNTAMQLGFSFCLISAFHSSASSHIAGPQQFHSFKTSPPVMALAPVQQISSAQGEGAELGPQPITASNPRDGRRRLFFATQQHPSNPTPAIPQSHRQLTVRPGSVLLATRLDPKAWHQQTKHSDRYGPLLTNRGRVVLSRAFLFSSSHTKDRTTMRAWHNFKISIISPRWQSQ